MVKVSLIFITFLMLTISVSAELSNSAWPKYGQNINNTGLSPYESASNGAERWTFSTSTGEYFYYFNGVAIDGNTLYVGNGDSSKLHAIYRINGTEKWNYTTGDGVTTTPLVDINHIIYFGSWDDYFYAIYPNGTLKWSLDIGGNIEGGSASMYNGIIYQGTATGTNGLYAIYADNGTEKWNFSSGNGITSTPLIHDDIVYFGCLDNKLYALYIDNGTEKWNYTTGGDILDSPIFYNDNIYFGSVDKDYYSLYINGTKKWNYTKTGQIYASSIGNTGIIYLVGTDKNLTALYSNNGTLKWSFLTSDYIYNKPTIDKNEIIFVGNNLGDLYAIYPNGSSKFNWTDTYSNDGFETTISIDSYGVLYFTTWGNILFALSMGNPSLSDIYNTETNDNSTNIIVYMDNDITFSIVSNQTIDTYSWFKNGIAISGNNQNSFKTSFDIGIHNISVYGNNLDGNTNTILWNITTDYTVIDTQMNPLWSLFSSLVNNLGKLFKLIVYGIIIFLLVNLMFIIGVFISNLNKKVK